MKFDDIILQLGQFGPYQRRVYALICAPSIFIGMQTLATVFTMATPDYRCSLPSFPNDSYQAQSSYHAAAIRAFIPVKDKGDTLSSCKIWKSHAYTDINETFSLPWNRSELNSTETSSCHSWVYDQSVYESTLISKLDLVCQNKLGRSHVQMFFMLGSLLGTLFLGPPADFFGRRKMMMVSIVLQLLASVAIVFTPNIVLLCLFMMVSGASMSALYVVLFVMGMEFVGPQKRVYAGYIITLFFGIGVIFLVGLAYLIRNWQHLQLAISSVSVLFICYYWLIPESPRWLVNKGRYCEAEKIIQKAATVNKKNLPTKMFQWEDLETDGVEQEPMWKIVTYPRLLLRTLVIYFNWMVCSMTYYGISLNVADLAGSIYLNMFLYGVVEVISYILCVLFLDKLGRRRLHLLCMFVAGICCTAAPFPSLFLDSSFQWLGVSLAIMGKAGVSAAFATIWLYTSELFPTVVRNAGVSSSSFCARIGGIGAPYIANLSTAIESDIGRILPLLIFGLASLVAGSLSLLLPETSNATLPDTLVDANRFGKSTNRKPVEKSTDDQNELQSFNPVS